MSYYGWSNFNRYGPESSSEDEDENTMGPKGRRARSDDEDELQHQNHERLNNVLNADGGDAERALGDVSGSGDGDDDESRSRVIDGVPVDENLDEEAKEKLKYMCTECGDQPSVVLCNECKDAFCDVCFQAQHKRGNRKLHTTSLVESPFSSSSSSASASASNSQSNGMSVEGEHQVATQGYALPKKAARDLDSIENDNASNKVGTDTEEEADNDEFTNVANRATSSSSSSASVSSNSYTSSIFSSASRYMSSFSSYGAREQVNLSQLDPSNGEALGIKCLPSEWFTDKVRYIPLRLTMEERKFLRLIESTLTVSEYTDKIDIISSKDKVRRIVTQLKDVCAILTGLVVASDYKLGQQLCVDKEFKDNEVFFQDILELARRHKIRNPEKMRTAYGKLVYLLQDSAGAEVQDLLQFKLFRPIRTVYELLNEKNALKVLADPWIAIATGDIMTEGRSRPQINRSIKIKEAALAHLAATYSNDQLNADNLKQTIYSICDNHSYLAFNLNPITKMIGLLQQYFDANNISSASRSLAIVAGRNGARLTHSHEQQYHYCIQSLTLWAAIQHDFFRLWYLAEQDLLDNTNPYRLRNTGQGLNRVQSAPKIGRAMHNILHACQSKVGHWIGSSVIHLGDHNVPNALMFIDKYNQIARILNPIVLTINHIPKLLEKPDLRRYIEMTYGSSEKLILMILGDFFRHAFDGSGADNFFDAGSCIDGRLTSAWNWCSNIDKKPFYTIFLLSGFQGFDGEWNG